MTKQYYIGLMSGTSMDGVDAVLVNFEHNTPELIARHSEELPKHTHAGLQRLCLTGDDEINQLGQLDREVGELFAKAVQELLLKAELDAKQVIAIGSHGQTVRHMPNLEKSFTLQIGDPNTIAAITGIDVIADFRRKDIALGGQGAPLVPAFHQQMFADENITRIIVNIGGISNITFLPSDEKRVIGFDTGPGNTLIDSWIQQCKQQDYDVDGRWAAQGQSNTELLNHLLSHPYFSMDYPKSTGRELFNQAWLEQQIAPFTHIDEVDIQSTLLDLTCHSISRACYELSRSGELYVCGGGAFNLELMQRLQALLPQYKVDTTLALNMAPQWVEGIAFAWLAMRHQQKLPGNLPAVTGASRKAILGARYFAG